MNGEINKQQWLLSWQGGITGPHSLREIQTLLKLGKVHSLYRIQVEGEWILLRDRFADLEQKAREAEGKKADRLPVRSPAAGSGHAEPIPAAIFVPDEEPWELGKTTGHSPQSGSGDGSEIVESKGIAIASFVLSLFFFVPFLNGITWLLSLIFGHLALSQTSEKNRSGPAVLAWIGLWLSYVEISFFLLGIVWFALMGIPDAELGFILLHAQMLSSVIGALIGAGVLMLAVKMTSGSLVGFPVCFVGALPPSALNFLGVMLVQASLAPGEMFRPKGIVSIGVIYAILFITQMFFWARLIHLPEDDSELGLARGALASLLYTFVFVFIGFGYAVLFAALA